MASSEWRILDTVLINPSNPFRRIVSVYPLSALHSEHIFVMTFSPLYQVLTHSSQPIMFLQHLTMITGGCNRLPWQMLHLKTSQMTLCSLKGRFVLESLVDDLISSILFLIALTLSISFAHLSIFTLLCGLKSLSSPSSSSLIESLMFCNTANTFLLALFQNASPNKYR